jgi:hypothetical protein
MLIRWTRNLAVCVILIGLLAAPTAFADEPASATDTPVPAPAAEAATETAPASEAAPAGSGSAAACGHADVPKEHGNLAGAATDPTASLIAFKLQNYFVVQSMDKAPIDADGYANQFDVQAVLPIPKLGWFPRSIFRPTIPLVTTPDMEADLPGGLTLKQKSKTGLGDIQFVWLPVHDFSWGTVGFGPAGAFPTATDKLLGARKWTLGPAAVVLIKAIPKVQIGGLLFNTWSVGGRGDNDVNSMTFQPILTWHFAPGWYTGLGDTAYSFDWENDNQIYAPLSYRLGKIVSLGKQHIDVNGQFIYNVGDRIPGKDRWGFKFTLNFLFPAG